MERTDRALVEAAEWAALSSDDTGPSGLRTEALRPADLVMREHPLPRAHEEMNKERALIVSRLVAARRELLARKRAVPYRDPPLWKARGRILVTCLEDSFFDGATQGESAGFFDINDLPPWDTWITYARGRAHGDDWALISWVPFAFIPRVEAAIDVHIFAALEWHGRFSEVVEYP